MDRRPRGVADGVSPGFRKRIANPLAGPLAPRPRALGGRRKGAAVPGLTADESDRLEALKAREHRRVGRVDDLTLTAIDNLGHDHEPCQASPKATPIRSAKCSTGRWQTGERSRLTRTRCVTQGTSGRPWVDGAVVVSIRAGGARQASGAVPLPTQRPTSSATETSNEFSASERGSRRSARATRARIVLR